MAIQFATLSADSPLKDLKAFAAAEPCCSDVLLVTGGHDRHRVLAPVLASACGLGVRQYPGCLAATRSWRYGAAVPFNRCVAMRAPGESLRTLHRGRGRSARGPRSIVVLLAS